MSSPAEPERVELRVAVRAGCEDVPLPDYATAGSAGLDLRAAVEGDLVIVPGGRTAVPTGLTVAIPAGWEGQVRPRSGLALRSGLTVANAPGTIDSDYRGELLVLLVNLGTEPVTIRRRDRIAQLLIARTPRVTVRKVDELPESDRGEGGFGSTGAS